MVLINTALVFISFVFFYTHIDAYVMPMDDKEFNSSMFQRVFQYLQRHNANVSLDRFMYAESSVEGTAMECLVVLLG